MSNSFDNDNNDRKRNFFREENTNSGYMCTMWTLMRTFIT